MVFLISGTQIPAKGEIFKTFVAEFIREYSTQSKQETLKGKLFYEADSGKLLIEVDTPIHQWMILQGNETLIYYPETMLAFRIRSKAEAVMPFFKVILGCLKEDFGLSQQGYALAHYEKKGNVLLSTWSPPPQLSKLIGKAVLEYQANKIMRIEYQTPDGKLLSQAIFHQHVFFSGSYFPLEVSISYKTNQDSRAEKVVYVHPQFNAPLPGDVREFKIPAGAKVKDIEW
jgi:outer membrane lipoprotein-sorting protein